MREIKYKDAIAEAHIQSMKNDPGVFLMGVGIADPTGIFGTVLAVKKKFGRERVFDTPLSENTITGVGVGAALCGMKPVLIHARTDFLLLTLDQIANHAAKWRYMSGGKFNMTFLIRAIIGRGWGGAAQHSQSVHAVLAHFPGLQVIMPSTPYDVKGMILNAMKSEHPTICIEHRWLHEKSGPVPENDYTIPFGKGEIVRKGKDVTIVAVSHMVLEAKTAAEECTKHNIDVEIIDPRTIRPLDEAIILESVKKTGRLIIVDTSWKSFGVSAEIAALCAEKALRDLKAPVVRIALPEVPTPCSYVLENVYYPTSKNIVQAIQKMMSRQTDTEKTDYKKIREKEFSGPF